MAKISPFKIGLFFILGVGITLGGLLWIGATHIFEDSKTYETFFNESVDGLDDGTKVSFKGVKVGRVSDIDIAPDGNLIRVQLEMIPNFHADGMVVKLMIKGVTGGQYLAIEKAPPNLEEITPKISFPHKYPLIPASPGEMRQIEESLKKVYHKIESLDLAGLIDSWKGTGQKAQELVSDKDIYRTIRNIKTISADIKNVVSILEKPGTRQKWSKSFDNLADTAASARKTANDLNAQIDKVPPGSVGNTVRELENAVFQVNQVLTNVKSMVHELQEEPGKILKIPKGKEPFKK